MWGEPTMEKNDPKQTEYEVLKEAQDKGRMDNEALDPGDVVATHQDVIEYGTDGE